MNHSPKVAGSQRGLTTQVPTLMIYRTDDATTKMLLGERQMVFQRNTERNLALAGRASGLDGQASQDCGQW